MRKFFLLLSALASGALPLLFADNHRVREKECERDQSRGEERVRTERIKKEELRIYEVSRDGKITKEEGRRELDEIHHKERGNRSETEVRRQKELIDKAHQIRRKQNEYEHSQKHSSEHVQGEIQRVHTAVRKGEISHEEGKKKLDRLGELQKKHERERFWKRVEEEIEGAVRSGHMSRKQAEAEYERIKRTQKQKEEVARELHREIEAGMRDLHIAVREGVISEENARMEGDEMRRNLEHEIHAAHRRIDFESQERRIHQSIEEGRMSEEDGERRLVEMHRRMEMEERRVHDREREVRRHHEEREHPQGRRYWEDEEELWEQVAQGLKAAVRLGRMSEGEAREIWEEWRNDEEEEDHEHDHNDHEEE